MWGNPAIRLDLKKADDRSSTHSKAYLDGQE
jgi:hypothetical protein